MVNIDTKVQNTKKSFNDLNNLMPYGSFKLDSCRVFIEVDKCKIVDPQFKAPYVKAFIGEDNSVIYSDEVEFKTQEVRSDRGISSKFQITSLSFGGLGQSKEYYVCIINSKQLEEGYLEGVRLSNIERLYNYLISLKVLDFSLETLLNSYITDIDIALDVRLTKAEQLKLFELFSDITLPTKKAYIKRYSTTFNYNNRSNSKNTTPYVKAYNKGTELLNKSVLFYDTFIKGTDKDVLLKSEEILRFEYQLKNRKMVKYYDLDVSNLRDLLVLLNDNQDVFKDILCEMIKKYTMERIAPMPKAKLTRYELSILSYVDLLISKGMSTQEIVFIHTKPFINDKVKKSRAKKDILKLLQYVQEPDTLLKLDSMNKNVNKVMGFLGLFD